MTQMPMLELIICTYNNAALLGQVLAAIGKEKLFLSPIPQEIASW